MNRKPRLIAFHLLNDRSGSPKVLSQLIKGWVQDNREVWLYTSLHQDGFLSGITGVHYLNGWYRFKSNPWLRLLYFTFSQVLLFFRLLFFIRKSDTIYINTVLPFGAALLGKLKGARVVYHMHESTVRPAALKWFLFKVAHRTATDMIHVSEYVAGAHARSQAAQHLVYNSIDEDFLSQVSLPQRSSKPTHVLMICSLKWYKGVFEFIRLANDNPNYRFRLVLNANEEEIHAFFKSTSLPENLAYYPAQKNLHPFFQWADLLVNLSRPDGWIETFGLTILEGMAYGLPSLVPPTGGIAEVIEEGVTGYSVDARNTEALNDKLNMLLQDQALYQSFSRAAAERVQLFREGPMLRQVNRIVWQTAETQPESASSTKRNNSTGRKTKQIKQLASN